MASTGEATSRQILASIVLSTAVIFYLDIITPVGFMIGILYFIPLLLTAYVAWRPAPFLSAGASILLIFAGFLFSPRDVTDISVLFAFADRLFLSFMLVVSAFFVQSYIRSQEDLRLDEERYRSLAEWSPDAIVVSRDGKVVYANPAALRLLGAGERERVIGRDFLDLLDPAGHGAVVEKTGQVMLGARMILDDLGVLREGGTMLRVQASAGRITWDGRPAIQVHFRESPGR
ncbi:MAG TPA: PAS domain S-box protein [Methanomicrobiales archaeon]|nr:PAS domain S-box protein [Methanomicrobiales archaeon]